MKLGGRNWQRSQAKDNDPTAIAQVKAISESMERWKA